MAETSRTRRSAQNALVGVGSQIVLIGLSFVTRTVFIAQLGTELLGVHTLLVSLMAMLAVADLGINTALMHALYKPLQAGDHPKAAGVVRYASKLYRRVAIAVGLIGLASTPFLDHLVNLDDAIPRLRVYFLILLLDSVAMYLMVHRSILITADQRMYRVKGYTVLFSLVKSAAQIAALLLWQSFLIFLVIQTLFTVLTNVFLYWKAGRWYPFLREPGYLDADDRRTIGRSVRAMIIYRAGGIVLHNTDPLLISVIVGTIALGYYSNYLLIVGSIVMLTEVAFKGISPSVGNLVAARARTAATRVLAELTLLSTTVYGMGAAALLVGLDHLIYHWLGEEFVLGPAISAAVALNFYVVGVMTPIWAFRSATGMFRETQYVFLVTAVLNLVLSLVLGYSFGLLGILLATAVARVLTGSWYEPWILLSRHLDGSTKTYLLSQLRTFALWVALGSLGLLLTNNLDEVAATAVAISYIGALPLIAWLIYRRTDAFRGLSARISSFFGSGRP